MKKTQKILLSASLFLLAIPAHAQIFQIKATNYGALGGNAAFVSFVNEELRKIENDINKDLPNAQTGRLMEGMANTSVLSTKGIGTDYASNMDVFLIGAGLGVGLDYEKAQGTDSDFSGAGVASGIVIGSTLNFLGYDRTNIYFNFMNYNHKQTLNNKVNEKSSLELGMFTIGAHIRYQMVSPVGGKLLGWGGVKFHTGYDYNSTKLTFKNQLSESVNTTSATNENIAGTINGNPVAEIDVATHTIPIELSTDVQILYVLSLYGGFGMDINFGQAKGKADLNADESTINCTGGACGGGNNVQVQASANLDGKGDVASYFLRGFGGVQLNLPFFRVYAQVNKPIGNDLMSYAAGLRFVY